MNSNFFRIDLGSSQERLFSHQYYANQAYTTYALGCAALASPLLDIKTVLEFYPDSFAARTNIKVTDEVLKLPLIVQNSFIRHPRSLECKYSLLVNKHCTKVLGPDGCARFEIKSGKYDGQDNSFVLSVYFGHTLDKSAFHDMRRSIPPKRPLTNHMDFYYDLHTYAKLLEDTVNGLYQDLHNYDLALEFFEPVEFDSLIHPGTSVLNWSYKPARTQKLH